MKIPFTIEQFLSVFKAYNDAIWPTQAVAYLFGIVAVAFILRPKESSGRIVSAVLGVFWLWNGIFYHIIFFSRINPVALWFGVLFAIQGLLFLWYGVAGGKLRFSLQSGFAGAGGLCFIAYAMVFYPALGYAFGHTYPAAPVFGVAPCPTTIFTFGILLLSVEPIPLGLVVIPLVWSVVGISAAVNLLIIEDYGLAVAGVLGTSLILARMKKKTGTTCESRSR